MLSSRFADNFIIGSRSCHIKQNIKCGKNKNCRTDSRIIFYNQYSIHSCLTSSTLSIIISKKIMKEKKEGIILRFYTEKNVSPEGKTFYIHLKFNEFHFPCRHLPRDGDRQGKYLREQPKSSYF